MHTSALDENRAFFDRRDNENFSISFGCISENETKKSINEIVDGEKKDWKLSRPAATYITIV